MGQCGQQAISLTGFVGIIGGRAALGPHNRIGRARVSSREIWAGLNDILSVPRMYAAEAACNLGASKIGV